MMFWLFSPYLVEWANDEGFVRRRRKGSFPACNPPRELIFVEDCLINLDTHELCLRFQSKVILAHTPSMASFLYCNRPWAGRSMSQPLTLSSISVVGSKFLTRPKPFCYYVATMLLKHVATSEYLCDCAGIGQPTATVVSMATVRPIVFGRFAACLGRQREQILNL